MKISQIECVAKAIQLKRFKKNSQLFSEHLNIHNGVNSECEKQIQQAGNTIANYARKNGVTIDIFDAQKILGESNSNLSENHLNNKLDIHVTDLLTNKSEQRFISADTNSTHPYTSKRYIVIDYPDEGIQRIRKAKSVYEDTFLRHLYRNISEMVDTLKNKK